MNWFSISVPKISRPSLGKLEAAYYQHNFKTDVAQATFGFMYFSVIFLVFIWSDHYFFGFTPMFFKLAAVRLASLVITMALLFFLKRAKTYPEFQNIALLLAFNAIIWIEFVDWSRPLSYIGYAPINTLIILGFYLVVPIQLGKKVLVASIFNLFEILDMVRTTLTAETKFVIIIAYVAANLLGVILSYWLDSYRRYNFLLLKMEEREKKKLRSLAMIDPLTRAKNRRAFTTQGRIEVERAKRHGHPLSIALLDMDSFKVINDTHGHGAGDKVLKHFTRLIKQNIRKQDIFARLGGDEFGLLMPETSQTEAAQVVDRIIKICHQAELQIGTDKVCFSISIGAVQQDSHSFDHLMRHADKVLYQAKQNGGNQIVWSTKENPENKLSNRPN